MHLPYLRTVKQLCAAERGAVIACIGIVELRFASGAVDHGQEGQWNDVNIIAGTVVRQSLLLVRFSSRSVALFESV